MVDRIKGSTIGNYVVNKLIGEGTYGKVYKCKNYENNEIMALKEIKKESDTLSSAQVDIKMLKEVKGEYIIDLIDSFEDPANIYLVYKYCQDRNLEQYMIRHGGKLEENKVKLIMNQIISGYEELYKHKIIHRDIKLKNLLVTYKNAQSYNDDTPTIKIADFGISKEVLSDYLNQTSIQTLYYSAPELLNGDRKYDYKVDIWAIGVTMYYLLHNKYPFMGEMKQLIEVLKAGAYQISEDISILGLDLICKCLQYESHQRISFEEMKIHPFITDNKDGWKPVKTHIDKGPLNKGGIVMLQLNIKNQFNIIANENNLIPSPVKDNKEKPSVKESKLLPNSKKITSQSPDKNNAIKSDSKEGSILIN